MRFGFVHAWWDFWVGAYYDRRARRLYVLPLPTLGFWIERTPPPQFGGKVDDLFPPGMVGSDPDLSLRQRMRGRRLDTVALNMTAIIGEIAANLGLPEEDVREGIEQAWSKGGTLDDGEAT